MLLIKRTVDEFNCDDVAWVQFVQAIKFYCNKDHMNNQVRLQWCSQMIKLIAAKPHESTINSSVKQECVNLIDRSTAPEVQERSKVWLWWWLQWMIEISIMTRIVTNDLEFDHDDDCNEGSKAQLQWWLQMMFVWIKMQVTKIDHNDNRAIKIMTLDYNKVTQDNITTRTRSRVLRVQINSTMNQIGFQVWKQVLLCDDFKINC